jgi:hypothetical protein
MGLLKLPLVLEHNFAKTRLGKGYGFQVSGGVSINRHSENLEMLKAWFSLT